MKYDFDTIIPRRGTHSYKWDSPEAPGTLPMWVADMDFRAAPPIIAALEKRVQHGIFGYTRIPAECGQAVTGWLARRHGWKPDPSWIVYTTGVVPALSAIIRALTVPGDKVLVQTPVYNCFFSSIRNNGCLVEENPLLYRQGKYLIDFEDLEIKAADPAVKLLLLCNPHNPAGRVWSRRELAAIESICRRNGVFVVADEIHNEIVFPGFRYTPFASLSEEAARNSATCISPSKAFNLAGLQMACIVAADAGIRQRIDKAVNINEVCDVNAFAVNAFMAAYNEGEEWLDELITYLDGNYRTLVQFMSIHLPQFQVLPLEGTYLAWIDCSASGKTGDALAGELLEKAGLMVNAGSMYGRNGEHFIRVNLACPRTLLLQGLDKLKSVLAPKDEPVAGERKGALPNSAP